MNLCPDQARQILDNWLEEKGDLGELVDSNLGGHYDTQQFGRMAICVAACINHSANKRPRMSEVPNILITIKNLNLKKIVI